MNSSNNLLLSVILVCVARFSLFSRSGLILTFCAKWLFCAIVLYVPRLTRGPRILQNIWKLPGTHSLTPLTKILRFGLISITGSNIVCTAVIFGVLVFDCRSREETQVRTWFPVIIGVRLYFFRWSLRITVIFKKYGTFPDVVTDRGSEWDFPRNKS